MDNPNQTQAQYLFNNYNQFPAEMMDKVIDTTEKLLRYRMGTMLQGDVTYTQADVEVIAEAIRKTAIGKKDEFVPTIAVLTAQIQGEKEYFAAVQKNYNKMNKSDRINIALAIGDVIKSTDVAFCTKVNKWLRSKLVTMDYSAIYYAARSISSLERRINPNSEK